MSMSMQQDAADDTAPMADINTTPLVDIMLVLLIIFLITVPVVVQTVPLTLPKVDNLPTTTKPENASISVRAVGGNCETYWSTTLVPTSRELSERGAKKLTSDIERQGGPTAAGLELPEVHIRGDSNVPYRCVGAAIFAMQVAGFQKIGFISEPPAGSTVQR